MAQKEKVVSFFSALVSDSDLDLSMPFSKSLYKKPALSAKTVCAVFSLGWS